MAQGTSQRGPSGSREQPEPAQATLGGTGYNCPPLKLNYQKQSRINLNHYMFKKIVYHTYQIY